MYAKSKRSKPSTPRPKYHYYVQPIGQRANASICALLGSLDLPNGEDDLERLHSKGPERTAWRISELGMDTLYRSSDFQRGRDYEFYRKNLDSSLVTPVPLSKFQKTRNSPTVRAARAYISAARKMAARA